MRQPTHEEIEALRQRWRVILIRAREKFVAPTSTEIEAAKMSNDPIIEELLSETEKVLKHNSDRLLNCLKIHPENFQPARKLQDLSSTTRKKFWRK